MIDKMIMNHEGMNMDARKNLALAIIRLVKQQQRLLDANQCAHDHHVDCAKSHTDKLEAYISSNQRIQFILPAFPVKSANHQKTFGPMPDLGEQLALVQLNEMCKRIHAIYAPGAEIIICSDGRVFNDLVLVEDQHVDTYLTSLKSLVSTYNLNHIHFYDLTDYYTFTDYQSMRETLEQEYGDTVETIMLAVKQDGSAKSLFNGIHRFVFEDHINLIDTLSRNKIRKLAKATAYKVIQRSNAWGRLVAKEYPEAIRLSIHPQLCGSEKLGIMLLKSENVWATPWHRVVIYKDNQYSLVRKSEAEAMGALPVFNHHQFSHYTLTRN
jgi:pyoverdine/dityrosine biosynthesis protein Dit1